MTCRRIANIILNNKNGKTMRKDPVIKRHFISFDGGVRQDAFCQRPDRYRTVERISGCSPIIARGGGYSYSAASFSENSLVVDMCRFNRILSFDPQAGIVEVEAGMTVASLLEFAAPRGFWLPLLPGYPEITIGGCIGANVHGKNPYRHGSFAKRVVNITLYHPAYGIRHISPESDREIFEITCGGYGLTGVILSASLRLQTLVGVQAVTVQTPVRSLAESLSVTRQASKKHEFAYSFNELAPFPETFGRGCVIGSDILSGPSPSEKIVPKYFPITPESRALLPYSIWGGWRTRFIEQVYWLTEASRRKMKKESLFRFVFPFAANGKYFLFYGRNGLVEYQVIIPDGKVEMFLSDAEKIILDNRMEGVMGSMKPFKGRQRFLRYEMDGICVTFNFARTERTLNRLPLLDKLLIDAGGLPNLIKDSRIPREVVAACYPELEETRNALRNYDPDRLFRSELSERIGL
jgi:decaprenylphospho-beta-D-ribofuranose 2-oxidase